MQVITQHPAVSSPFPSDVTPSNPLGHAIFPMLQSVLQTNISQRDCILNLMKQVAVTDSTGCMSTNTTVTDKSSLEAAHDGEKDLLREISDLQWRLICAQEELQKYRTENAQITRVYKEKKHAEFEFVVGPILVDDGFGKEIVTHIKSKIGNEKIFYIDSNGRDFLEREANEVPDEYEDESEIECQHAFILKDDIGDVCHICGVIKSGIETIIEYNFFKVSSRILGRMPESRKMERFQLVEEHWVLQCRLLSGI